MAAITGDSPAGAPGGAERAVDLTISGMTCASCAARIEKKLNKLDGVTATVNFATEKARVSFPATISPGDLISCPGCRRHRRSRPVRTRSGRC